MTMLLARGAVLLWLIASLIRPIESMDTLRRFVELLQKDIHAQVHKTSTTSFVVRCLVLSVRLIILLVLLVTQAAMEDFTLVHERMQQSDTDPVVKTTLPLLQTDMQHSPANAETDEVPPTPPTDDEGTKAWHHPVVEPDLKTNTEAICLGTSTPSGNPEEVTMDHTQRQDEVVPKETLTMDDSTPLDEPYHLNEEAELTEWSNNGDHNNEEVQRVESEASEITEEALGDNLPSKTDKMAPEDQEAPSKESLDSDDSVTSCEVSTHLGMKEDVHHPVMPNGLAKAMEISPPLTATSESQSSLQSPSEAATTIHPSAPSSDVSRRSSSSTMPPAFKSRLQMAVQKVTSREHNPSEADLVRSPERTASTKLKRQVQKTTKRFSKLFHKKSSTQ